MAIPKIDLEKMNELLEHGSTIADICREYKGKYDYWDILYSVNNYSMLGAKRKITNRLDRLQNGLKKQERQIVVKEIKEDLKTLYSLARSNGKKLSDIMKVLGK